jgi:hypothetical protein
MDAAKLTKWFGLYVVVTLCATRAVQADWTYPYSDDFSTDRAETDSYRHSAFWPRENVPLREPYLSYLTIDKNQGIAFFDYLDRPAELGYRFPTDGTTTERSVKGVLALDVSFPSTPQIDQYWPGRLTYQTSPDGMGWSEPVELMAGHHEFPIFSASGVCYVLFSGTRVVIDNLTVSLNSKPVTIVVPDDFAKIQDALDVAGDGDVIEVKPGTYRGQGNRDLDCGGKAVTLRSAAGPQTTTIDWEREPTRPSPASRSAAGASSGPTSRPTRCTGRPARPIRSAAGSTASSAAPASTTASSATAARSSAAASAASGPTPPS